MNSEDDMIGAGPAQQGTAASVVAGEDSDTFELNTEEEAELVRAMAEADEGVFIDGGELLRELQSP